MIGEKLGAYTVESEVGKKVRHPNVVRTLDCDALGGHHFLVIDRQNSAATGTPPQPLRHRRRPLPHPVRDGR